MPAPAEKAQPCPRCGALNGVGFDRCIRCNAALQPLAAGHDALKGSVDGRQLWGTKIIVALTALVFFGQLAVMRGAGLGALLTGGSEANLLRFGALLSTPHDVGAQPYRLLSAMFVHIGALHVAMNLMSLVNIGRVVEPAVGSARFVVAYLVSGTLGFAANVAFVLVFPHRGLVPILTAGASGAVFGAMGLILGLLIRRRDKRWRSFAVQAVFFALVLNLLGLSINNGAHLGGLACGAAFGFYYAGDPRPRNLLAANVGAVLGLLLSVASLVLAQRAAAWGKQPFPIGALDLGAPRGLADPAPIAASPALAQARPTPLPLPSNPPFSSAKGAGGHGAAAPGPGAIDCRPGVVV